MKPWALINLIAVPMAFIVWLKLTWNLGVGDDELGSYD